MATVTINLNTRYNKIVTPSHFDSWLGIKASYCFGVGQCTYDNNVLRYAKEAHSANIVAGEIWVDGVNGSNSNAGTEEAPVQTIEHAVRNMAASQVYVKAGNYPIFQHRLTDTSGTTLKIVTALGEVNIVELADDATTATWVQDLTYPDCWYMDLTPAYKATLAVTDSSTRDKVGMPRSLARYTSLALLDANASGAGYFRDAAANRLYVKYTDSLDVNTIKSNLEIINGDATSRCLFYGNKIVLDGDFQFKGVFLQPLVHPIGATIPYMYMSNIGFNRPTINFAFTHGIDSLGAVTYFQGTWIHRTKGDNFHYTDNSGIGCKVLEIDVRSSYAGDKDGNPLTTNTSNASSAHLNTDLVRYNGLYELSYGPEIVDTGTGKTFNVGCKVGEQIPTGNSYGIYTTGPEMWNIFCDSVGAYNFDIAAVTNGVMRLFATNFKTQSTATGGVIDLDYNPFS